MPRGALLLDECRRALARRGVTDRYDTLSDREREVLQLMAEGRSNKAIAEILGVPDDRVIVAIVVLGYPGEQEASSPPKNPDVAVYVD